MRKKPKAPERARIHIRLDATERAIIVGEAGRLGYPVSWYIKRILFGMSDRQRKSLATREER